MTRRSLRQLIIGLAAACLLAAGCGGDDAENAGEPEASRPNQGDAAQCEGPGNGSVTMGVGSPIQTLDPVTQNSGSQGGSERAAIYDTLMRFDTDTNEFEPHLAKSLVPNETTTEWTLVLRDGVEFGNGDPLTADTVKASIERHLVEGATTNLRLPGLDEIEVVDDHTLIFHLTEPWGEFEGVLSANGGEITNPKIVDELGEEFGSQPSPGAGVGPYEVTRFAPGEELIMKAKSDYWGGPVCLETLRFIDIPGDTATLDAFDLDEVQVAYMQNPIVIDDAKSSGIEGHTVTLGGSGYILMNNGAHDSSPATGDERIRAAVAHALDPDVLNERLFEGNGLMASSIVDPDSPFYPGIEGPSYDPELAAELVQEAKSDGWSGKLRLVCSNKPEETDASILYEGLLESVGIDVERQNLLVADKITTVNRADFDLACWSIQMRNDALWTPLSNFYSDAGNSYTGLSDPRMDSALDALKAAATAEEKTTALADLQQIWNETIPSAIYGSNEVFIAIDEDLKGVIPTAFFTLLFHDASLEA